MSADLLVAGSATGSSTTLTQLRQMSRSNEVNSFQKLLHRKAGLPSTFVGLVDGPFIGTVAGNPNVPGCEALAVKWAAFATSYAPREFEHVMWLLPNEDLFWYIDLEGHLTQLGKSLLDQSVSDRLWMLNQLRNYGRDATKLDSFRMPSSRTAGNPILENDIKANNDRDFDRQQRDNTAQPSCTLRNGDKGVNPEIRCRPLSLGQINDRQTPLTGINPVERSRHES